MAGRGWQIRTCRKTQTRSSRGILERKWGINCRKGLGRGAGCGMHSSLWLATICPCHLTSHSLPLLPAQGAPSSSHPSWAGAPGKGRRLVPAPTVSIPAGTREETKPREADKRTPCPLCQAAGLVLLAGTRGTAEPRHQVPPESRGAAWLRRHVTWVPTHSYFCGARNHPISSPFFFYSSCLCLPAQAPQHGVPAQAAPSVRPSPAAILEKGRRYF